MSSEEQQDTSITTHITPDDSQSPVDDNANNNAQENLDTSINVNENDNETNDQQINVIKITLLLISGQRMIVPIDSEFMNKNDLSGNENPLDISIGTLKTSLFKDWQESWGNPPAKASNIRLIHLGKILEDEQSLADCGISNDSLHNVVHLSVKPESFELDTSSKSKTARKNSSSNRNSDNTHSRCCVIQ